jgi:hypothetical protein
MGQFCVKRLFASTAVAAVGAALLVAVRSYRKPLEGVEVLCAILIVEVAGACFGAAVLLPFKRAWIGALIGALAMLAWALIGAEQRARY